MKALNFQEVDISKFDFEENHSKNSKSIDVSMNWQDMEMESEYGRAL